MSGLDSDEVDVNMNQSLDNSSNRLSQSISDNVERPPSPSTGSRRARVDDDDDDNMQSDRERVRPRTHAPSAQADGPSSEPSLPAINAPQTPNEDLGTTHVTFSRTTMQFTLSSPDQDPFAMVNIVVDGTPIVVPNGPPLQNGPNIQPIGPEFAFNSGPISAERVLTAFNQLITAFPGGQMDRQPDEARAKRILKDLEKLSPGLVERINTVGGVMGGLDGEHNGATCAVCWESLVGDGSFGSLEPKTQPQHGTSEAASAGISTDPDELQDSAVVALPCRHLYHASCLVPWFSRQTTCPSCRFNLDPEHLTREQPRFAPVATAERPTGNNDQVNAPQINDPLATPLDIPVAPTDVTFGNTIPTPAGVSESTIPQPLDQISVVLLNGVPQGAMPLVPPDSTQPNNNVQQQLVNEHLGNHDWMTNMPTELRMFFTTLFGPNATPLTGPVPVVPPLIFDGQESEATVSQADGLTTNTSPASDRSQPSLTEQPAPPAVEEVETATHPPIPLGSVDFIQTMAAATATHIPASVNNVGMMPAMQPLRREPATSTVQPSGNAASAAPPPFTGAGSAISAYLQAVMRSRMNAINTTVPHVPNSTFLSNFMPGTTSISNTMNIGNLYPRPPANARAGRAVNVPAEPTGASTDALQPPPGAANLNSAGRSGPTPMPFPAFGLPSMEHMFEMVMPDAPAQPGPPPPATRQTATNSGVNQQRGPFASIPLPFATSMMGGGLQRGERKEWTVPEGKGASIRERVEEREKEAGLRCCDPSCGFAPTDDCPVVPTRSLGLVTICKDASTTPPIPDGTPTGACSHGLHAGCLVTAARIAGYPSPETSSNTGRDVEVSCPLCRAQGHIETRIWYDGVKQLASV